MCVLSTLCHTYVNHHRNSVAQLASLELCIRTQVPSSEKQVFLIDFVEQLIDVDEVVLRRICSIHPNVLTYSHRSYHSI
jgi:hypothetical protein